MSILETHVMTRISNKNISHYEKLGYVVPKIKNKNGKMIIPKGTQILVKVEDLTHGSNVRVTKICDTPNCGKTMPNKTYGNILLHRKKGDGKDRCGSCGNLHMRKLERENVPYERSLEFFAKDNNMDYLLDEFSNKNNTTTDNVFRASNLQYYWNCKECKSEFIQSSNTRTQYKCRCPYCAGQRVNDTNSLASIYPILANELHPTKNKKLFPNEVHFGSQKYVWWKCSNNSNHEWKAKIETRSIRKYGCPICAESKGEKRIRQWLEENEIKFMAQKEYKYLLGTGNGLLSYDFYLPKKNILIEYQGQYHDGTANNQTEKEFEIQQEHDRRKKEYAIKNNIKLLEIWYWDFENVEEILNNELGGVE
jgi:hypothetical protein